MWQLAVYMTTLIRLIELLANIMSLLLKCLTLCIGWILLRATWRRTALETAGRPRNSLNDGPSKLQLRGPFIVKLSTARVTIRCIPYGSIVSVLPAVLVGWLKRHPGMTQELRWVSSTMLLVIQEVLIVTLTVEPFTLMIRMCRLWNALVPWQLRVRTRLLPN